MNNVQKVLTVAEAEKGYLEKKTRQNLYDKTGERWPEQLHKVLERYGTGNAGTALVPGVRELVF